MAMEALLERPEAEPAPPDRYVSGELGGLAVMISEEFGIPSAVEDSVTITERYTGPDDDYNFKYFNLRYKENLGWKFDYALMRNPESEAVTVNGGFPGQANKDADRPWMDLEKVEMIDDERSARFYWAMQMMMQDLIERNIEVSS